MQNGQHMNGLISQNIVFYYVNLSKIIPLTHFCQEYDVGVKGGGG